MSKSFWITRRICLSTYHDGNYRSLGLYFFGYSFNFSMVGRKGVKSATKSAYVDDLMDYPS